MDLKKCVNSILNGGKGESDCAAAPTWLKLLYTEVQTAIQPAICSAYPDVYQMAVTLKTQERAEHDRSQLELPKTKRQAFFYNPAGSTLSWIMDGLEHKCLMALDDYGTSTQLWGEDVALEFDGEKVPLDTEGCDMDDLIAAMQRHIFAKTGYGPLIKIKKASPKRPD